MNVIHTLVSFVVALGVLIIVHEFGHYLAARLCGVKVLRFSVGFGKPLIVFRTGSDRTEWVLAAIPFGGYVKMLDEREAPVEDSEVHRTFNRKGVGARILIVAAGPLFNFAFAVVGYAAMYVYGIPEARPVLASPPAGTRAAEAGFKEGDTVIKVGESPIQTWQEFRWKLTEASFSGKAVQVTVEGRTGMAQTQVLDFGDAAAASPDENVLEAAGLALYRPPLPAAFGQIVAGSPAERAGLLAGDKVIEAGGKAVQDWESLVAAIRKSPGKELALVLQRGGTIHRIVVVPDPVLVRNETIGRIGAGPEIRAGHAKDLFVRVSLGPVDAVLKGVSRTYEVSVFSLQMLGRILVGEASWKHISGPVTIADYAGQSAQMGWVAYLTFLCLVSISLGVLNLLPVPLLDGGHLMYYSVELIKGSPVSERAMEYGQRVGLTLLLIMMAFAFYNDLNRIFSS